MNKLNIILIILLSISLNVVSQDEPERDAKKIQAMEVAYITRELNLTPEEAQKFWPVYNQYRQEVKGVVSDKSIADQLERQQRLLDIRKKYRTEFSRILTTDRGNRVYPAEDQFRQMLRREFQRRQNERRQINQGKRGG